LIKLTLLFISLITGQTVVAAPIVPQFRSGEMRVNSTSQSVLTETVVSHSFKTGYSYSVMGQNIKPIEGTSINPTPTATATQVTNNVNYNWTSPQLETIPQWQIVNEAAPFSLVEHVSSPGLESIVNVSRTVETTQTSESISLFGP